MKPQLIVNGAAGRMGKRIIALAAESELFDIAAAVDIPQSPDQGKDAGLAAGIGQIGVEITSEYPVAADVMIDFSLPEATDAVIVINHHSTCQLIQVHGFRHRAGLFAKSNFAVPTHNEAARAVFAGGGHLYPCQIRIDRTCLRQ